MKRTGFAGLAAGTLFAALVSTAALAQGAPPDPPPPPADDGGPGHGMHHGGRGGPDGPRGPGMMMPGMEGHMLMRMADELDLSQAQRDKIRGLFEQAQPGFRKLHEQTASNVKLLMDTQPDDPKYQSVVQQAAKSSAELAQQMVVQSSQLRTQVWGVLTPDQRAKFQAKQKEMRARWEERRGDPRGGPGDRDGPPPPPPAPPR
jgi:Spy/CpxP family protein refolding chaperone